jgi:hypothetical protein
MVVAARESQNRGSLFDLSTTFNAEVHPKVDDVETGS